MKPDAPVSFEIVSKGPDAGHARVGVLKTPHGIIPTPAFMPVGTQGTVKGLTPELLRQTGSSICLGNTYHLYLRPGSDIIRLHGGLHEFMGWPGPILTDSGGFQVFSLANLRKVDDEGVDFRSHIDGSLHRLTPELSVAIQQALGSDIAMCFDECPPADASRSAILISMARTTAWADRCLQAHDSDKQALFGIIQGGLFDDLRIQHANELIDMDFPGYAIGGLSVGETQGDRVRILDVLSEILPVEKPRYLMGVGRPIDIVEAVERGVDMMDCVLPTRNARMSTVYTGEGRLNLRNTQYRSDLLPLDDRCDGFCCQHFSRAYISHLIHAKELLAHTILTFHNLRHFQRLMTEIRTAIVDGSLAQLRTREEKLEKKR